MFRLVFLVCHFLGDIPKWVGVPFGFPLKTTNKDPLVRDIGRSWMQKGCFFPLDPTHPRPAPIFVKGGASICFPNPPTHPPPPKKGGLWQESASKKTCAGCFQPFGFHLVLPARFLVLTTCQESLVRGAKLFETMTDEQVQKIAALLTKQFYKRLAWSEGLA